MGNLSNGLVGENLFIYMNLGSHYHVNGMNKHLLNYGYRDSTYSLVSENYFIDMNLLGSYCHQFYFNSPSGLSEPPVLLQVLSEPTQWQDRQLRAGQLHGRARPFLFGFSPPPFTGFAVLPSKFVRPFVIRALVHELV